MKLPTLLPAMALIALLSFSCSTDTIGDQIAEVSNYVPQTNEVEILELINNYRITKGLTPLHNMSIIKAQAYGHTEYMLEKDEVSHANFYQRKKNLIDNAGAVSVAENVAYAFSTPESVVNAWINSEGHRHNIEGDYTDFDISAEKDADGKWYYTNIFIKK